MKTIYCPTKRLRPVVVDMARAMKAVEPGECLEIVSDQAFMVREAEAFARMQGCAIIRIASREVKTIMLSSYKTHQFTWNNDHITTSHQWLVWLQK